MKLPPNPLLMSYEGVAPVCNEPALRGETGSAVLGRVTLGGRAALAPFAVLRGDGQVIVVGADLHLGLHSTVHIAHVIYGTTIGDRVTVGANSVVHACTVGDDCVIQDQVVVLDGSVVGRGSVITAGSVVFPRSVLAAGQWYEGVPAVPVRAVGAEELHELHRRIRAATPSAVALAADPASSLQGGRDAGGYVAATVTGTGELRMDEGSSLWFGCVVEASGPGVTIAAGANVQDNSVLRAIGRAITIGPDCTVGHNVLLQDCTVGARSLIGMGSSLAPGTVVMDDVLLAAGSATSPGQVLDSGWLWGGRPARAMTRLDERKLAMIRQSAVTYREYAREFASVQAAAQRRAAA